MEHEPLAAISANRAAEREGDRACHCSRATGGSEDTEDWNRSCHASNEDEDEDEELVPVEEEVEVVEVDICGVCACVRVRVKI